MGEKEAWKAEFSPLCILTHSCFSSLIGYNDTNPNFVFQFFLHVAAKELINLAKLPTELAAKANSTAEIKAL